MVRTTATPCCERDADALLGLFTQHAHEQSIEALAAFHTTAEFDLALSDNPSEKTATEVLNMPALHIRAFTAKGPTP